MNPFDQAASQASGTTVSMTGVGAVAPVVGQNPTLGSPAGMGAMVPATGFGALSPTAVHGVTLLGAAGVGASVGFAAGRTPQGAMIGAGIHVAIAGILSAALGGNQLSTIWRVVYGVLGVGGAIGAGILIAKGGRR